MTYEFLQQYWWFVVSLLGALLVFLMFVQGGNAVINRIGRDDVTRRLVLNATGRKWEFTFTTLVTFGGAFFASFPLFYSTSFGGAYWLWMTILFTFVLQAVSYEFQNKMGNLLGPSVFRFFLVVNGIVGPLLLGAAVATFFEGSNFIVEKNNLVDVTAFTPAISRWANASHGLDALRNPWVVLFGVAVMFLSRMLGLLYVSNAVDDAEVRERCRRILPVSAVSFLVLFVAFLVHLMLKDGYAVGQDGVIYMMPHKYLNNMLAMWPLALLLVVGVLLVVGGLAAIQLRRGWTGGIWPVGIGTVLTVLALLLCAGWGDTAYYPSTADLQSSLTLQNSCSSEFTLRTMFWVSLLVPVVLAYIVWCWYKMDARKLDREELSGGHVY